MKTIIGMKVCTIERKNDVVLFNGKRCGSVNDAYLLYRTLYNAALGKNAYGKYGHVGQRVERITETGIEFESGYKESLAEEFSGESKVRCYMLGMLGASYCRVFGQCDFGNGFSKAEDTERYIDWLLGFGMKNTRLCDRRGHTGRTSLNYLRNGRRKESNAG